MHSHFSVANSELRNQILGHLENFTFYCTPYYSQKSTFWISKILYLKKSWRLKLQTYMCVYKHMRFQCVNSIDTYSVLEQAQHLQYILLTSSVLSPLSNSVWWVSLYMIIYIHVYICRDTYTHAFTHTRVLLSHLPLFNLLYSFLFPLSSLHNLDMNFLSDFQFEYCLIIHKLSLHFVDCFLCCEGAMKGP
jgi:hypothetical protein